MGDRDGHPARQAPVGYPSNHGFPEAFSGEVTRVSVGAV